MKKLLIFALAALLIIPALSFAATPQLVSVHGKLTDTLNNPYSGSKNFAFRIYSAQSGGSALYTEFWNTTTQQVSLAYGGYFSVLLGSQTALALPFDQQYWLEITVEGETLSPRYKLGSTPYAYRANITENLAANANASGTLNMNSQSITNAAWLNATNLNVSSNGYFGGNVGVGTANPLSLLGIYQAGSNTVFNASNGTVNTGLYLGMLSGGNAGASIGTNSNHQFRLFSNGTDRLTIDTSGNVGIGTNLAVNPNNARLILRTGTDQDLAITPPVSLTSGTVISSYNDAATANVPLEIRSNLTVIPMGNVGIGTTSPFSSLANTNVNIVDAGGLGVATTGIAWSVSPIGYALTLNNANGGANSGGLLVKTTATDAGSYLAKFESGGVNRMTIRADGNVGIGTTSPMNSLDVVTGPNLATIPSGYAASITNKNNSIYRHGLIVGTNWQSPETFIANFGSYDATTGVYTSRVVIGGTGNVGIGTTSPSYQLQLSTDSAAKPSTNTWTIASDARIKTEIRPFTDSLSVIDKINPVWYQYNGKGGFAADGKDYIGVIAQDIEKVAPYTVSTYKARLNANDTNDTELLNFNSHALTFVLINAVKELDAKNQEQQKEIEALKSIVCQDHPLAQLCN